MIYICAHIGCEPTFGSIPVILLPSYSHHLISTSQHPRGQLLFHLRMGRLRLREIRRLPPRSHGWWAAEHTLSLFDSWDCVLSCSWDSVPRLGWPVCKNLKRRRLQTFPGGGPRCSSYSLHHWEILPGGQPQAFLPPWCLVKNAHFLNISKVRCLLIFDLTFSCLQLSFLFVAFIHCSVRLLVSSCWCFMLLRLIFCQHVMKTFSWSVTAFTLPVVCFALSSFFRITWLLLDFIC